MTDEIHAYEVKYTLADDESQTEHMLSTNACLLDDAVKNLVQSFHSGYNPANVDIVDVVCDNVNLGIDGVYAAEVILAKYYA